MTENMKKEIGKFAKELGWLKVLLGLLFVIPFFVLMAPLIWFFDCFRDPDGVIVWDDALEGGK